MSTQKAPLISIVCPFYNEGMGITAFYEAIIHQLQSMDNYTFEIVCVDDGSSDDTLDQLVSLSLSDPRIRVLELSRNFGKEAALTAGLDAAKGEAVIPIDSDLQDPPSLIFQLIDAWESNCVDIVLARRVNRASDSVSKRISAAFFYEIYNWMSHLKIPSNVGDCRLMTRIVVDAIKMLPEKQRFMKGLFTWVGFRTITITYTRESRYSGKSKFSGWRLWNFALEGITSFSSLPLRIWTYVGMIGALVTMCYGALIVLRTIIYGVDLPGYASILVSILFFGSLQLMGLGILGEYVGRIYMESKRRPIYLVRREHQHRSIADK